MHGYCDRISVWRTLIELTSAPVVISHTSSSVFEVEHNVEAFCTNGLNSTWTIPVTL